MMNTSFRTALSSGLSLGLFALGSAAFALPTNVTIAPAGGARFLTGQKFDLRVEGKGTGPFSATLTLDGTPVNFSSGVQNTTTTDGITTPGYGGFNLRGFSDTRPGIHTLRATFTDATGTTNATAQYEIIDVRGARRPARNIIICLGDGMGIAHRTAARIVRYGVTAGRPNGVLAMDQFPGYGAVTTHSLNTIITDSAPGMACYSTGNHANNNQEGVYPANVTNAFFAPRVEYMGEYLHRVGGKSLGILSTADVEDATPAANAVHTLNRNAGQGICDQYLDESGTNGLAVLMGGGRRWFLPAGTFGSSRSSSNDYATLPGDLRSAWNIPAGAVDAGRNLLADFQAAGFGYVADRTSLNAVPNTATKLLGLFGYGNMNVSMDKIAKRRNQLTAGAATFAVDDYHASDQPMLDEMASKALNVLNNNTNGFVMMVEGAHIDKQSHAMDADRAIWDVLEFDNAVNVCRQFADRVGDTVVIVLADHECSGFSIIGALTGGINNLKNLASDTGTLDPGTQPNRQKVVGTYDAAGFPVYNILADGFPATADIDNKILIGYGASGDRYEGWLSKPYPIVDSLLPNDIKGELTGKNYPAQPINRQAKNSDPFGDSRGFFLRGQAIAGDQAVHTASDIPVTAYSSTSRAFQLFIGLQENTDVFFKLMRAALGGY